MNQQSEAGLRACTRRQSAARIATGIALVLLLALSAAPAALAAGYVHVDSFGGSGSGLGQFNSP